MRHAATQTGTFSSGVRVRERATMKRRELESALLTLETTPLILHQIAFRGGPGGGLLSPNACVRLDRTVRMMAAIEEAVWAERIRRLLTEDAPVLPGLDGRGAEEQIAATGSPDWRSSLERFVLARGRNNARFRTVSRSEWDRTGTVPRAGRIALRDVPRLMAVEDRRHLAALAALGPEDALEACAASLSPAFVRTISG
jgi:hypothetical protein